MRHYHDSDAARLMDAVAEQGGRWLDETCASVEHEFIMPDGKVRTHLGTGCEEESKFLVAYDPSQTVTVHEPRLMMDPSPDAPQGRRISQKDPETREVLYDEVEHEGPGGVADRSFVHACANDDLMREWPRFRKLMRRGDPTRGQ